MRRRKLKHAIASAAGLAFISSPQALAHIGTVPHQHPHQGSWITFDAGIWVAAAAVFTIGLVLASRLSRAWKPAHRRRK